MRILLDIGHPAHVHLFRHAMHRWLERDHQVVITIRDKDITRELLERYGFAFTVASVARQGMAAMAIELVEHDWHVYRVARQHHSQVLLGTSAAISHVARFVGATSMLFTEDDAAVARLFVALAYPLAHWIVTPRCLDEDHGARHIKYDGYQKLAYLHPNLFTPNPGILSTLRVEPGEPFYILRFVALKAAHDRGEAGLDLAARRQLVQHLAAHGRVFISSETPLPADLEPHRISIPSTAMHDALALATMFIGDSQSMAVEAAVLGTPALRCNTFVGRLSVLEELEHRYALTYGFRPEETGAMFARIEELLSWPDLHAEWQARRARMLQDKIDVTAWMVDLVERFPQSIVDHRAAQAVAG